MNIYNSFEKAKNGTLIPVFNSGRTMESRYNPERDAQTLCNSIEEAFDFFLVLGIGSGLFIKNLSQRFPHAKILGLEIYKDDLSFLENSEIVRELEENSLIKLISLDQLEKALVQNYLPAKYGQIKIVEQKAWLLENKDFVENINLILKKTIGLISADYSVQAHFGKIWNSNILNNARLAEKYNFALDIDISKTAVIVAAGPSLDKTISLLKENQNFYIISTDTASSILLKNKINPDLIISIDGQNVSYNHFVELCPSAYAFDLSANFSAAKKIAEAGNKIFFFSSGHPLSTAISLSSSNHFPCLFSGAGTVTITALDFAVEAGFKNILILGADFSYSRGKAYAAGSYLDSLYNMTSSRLKSSEQTFSNLMFRTELISSGERKTTQVLQAYKASLEKYFIGKNIKYSYEDDIYRLTCSEGTSAKNNLFSSSLGNKGYTLKKFFTKFKDASPEEAETILLPYIAWLRNNQKYQKYSYSELLKLAFNSIVRYNI